VRIAWFSPMPPDRSGIAAYSAEILPLLRTRNAIDVFVDRWPDPGETAVFHAHDFVWKQRRRAYALTVFQMGNATCHDYMWAYLFRYPGLVVLHDAQLHQARALWLTKRWNPRRDDYQAEFKANHPDAPPRIADAVADGFGESLYQHWPLIRLVLQASRLTVVHNGKLMEDLAARYRDVALDAIRMGVSDPLVAAANGQTIRPRYAIPEHAVLVAAFGGITPEKRIGPLIQAFSAVSQRQPSLHLMLVGAEHEHYDVRDAVRRWNITDRVHITGYVADADLPAYLAAADACACLRWPTNRETSASWLRCLAAGRPTIVTDLLHTSEVPALDPTGWMPRAGTSAEPVAVSIDILDEPHSLQLALDGLADDDALRQRLGRAARAWWETHHRLDRMADDYDRVIARAQSLAVPRPAMPPHLTADGSDVARKLVETFGVSVRAASLL
jgi:glycosyltransferase involved in cell wall biosynthesis